MDCISKKSFAAFLIFVLVFLSCFAHWGDENTYFVGNLVPELIGVCIELLIVLGISKYGNTEMRKENELKLKGD